MTDYMDRMSDCPECGKERWAGTMHVCEEATKPKVITLCGSSRFPEAFHIANAHFSMQGYVVISLGLFGHADKPEGAKFLTSDGNEATKEKQILDTLHFRKIDLCDEIYVINVGGYIGSSTKREIAYAESKNKKIRWMFEN